MEMDNASQSIQELSQQIQKHIIWQQEVVNQVLIALFSGGHILLEWAPGLAKTKMVKTISSLISADFSRIQFTPDLLPLDLVGTEIYRQNSGEFETKKGPIFANIVLADEINRAPSKVQSALLEAMEEKQVTIGDTTYPLPDPFVVLATQNPIEQEGTYPLSEAQTDRFMMKVMVTYPNKTDEISILQNQLNTHAKKIKKSLSKKDARSIQSCIEKVFVDDKIFIYVADIIWASRPDSSYLDAKTRSYIQHGLSPRAGITLLRCARTKALMEGREFVLPEDIKSLVHPVFRHRIIPTFDAFSDDISVDDIIDHILSHIPIP